jgi:hypothetical protein
VFSEDRRLAPIVEGFLVGVDVPNVGATFAPDERRSAGLAGTFVGLGGSW